jgi:hypothetical protein
MTDSTWNAYDGRMTTPLLRCAPLATPRGRCHGINDEYLRRGAGSGSPLSFLAQESQTLVPSSAASVAHVSAPFRARQGSSVLFTIASARHCA